MMDLERYLEEITEDDWKRIDESSFIDTAERVAKVDIHDGWLTISINETPIYTGPVSDHM